MSKYANMYCRNFIQTQGFFELRNSVSVFGLKLLLTESVVELINIYNCNHF